MGDITIYTTPTCQYCKKTKSFLDDHDIDYTEYDVADDRDRAREMIDKSGQRGVPVIVIGEGDDEQIIVGFDQDKLEEALDIEA